MLTPKEIKRAAKEAKRAAQEQDAVIEVIDPNTPVDCACVIHGDAYSWQYVDTLYSMLTRNLSRPIRMHVYTEHDRVVPPHMIKHVLTEWPGIRGSKKSWWYKMQLFNSEHHEGQLLYLDLDTVIVNNLDWITQLGSAYFWAIHDFKTLWRPTFQGINSKEILSGETQTRSMQAFSRDLLDVSAIEPTFQGRHTSRYHEDRVHKVARYLREH